MTDNIGAKKLRAYAERVARLEDEKDALAADISEIRAELKAEGYSTKAFNAALKKYRMTPEKREEAEQLELEIETYWRAIQGGEE